MCCRFTAAGIARFVGQSRPVGGEGDRPGKAKNLDWMTLDSRRWLASNGPDCPEHRELRRPVQTIRCRSHKVLFRNWTQGRLTDSCNGAHVRIDVVMRGLKAVVAVFESFVRCTADITK